MKEYVHELLMIISEFNLPCPGFSRAYREIAKDITENKQLIM